MSWPGRPGSRIVKGRPWTADERGDEFLVVVDRATPARVDAVVAALGAVMAPKVRLGHRDLALSASVGISVSTSDGRTAADLVAEADAAMYRAKQLGRGRTALFDDDMRRDAGERSALERDLGAALQDGQLAVHYQPTYDLRSGRIVAMSALVRWNHPTRGVIPAGRFVPLAEEVGEVWAIDAFVLAESSRQLAEWQRLAGHEELTMSVNLSGQQLRDAHLAATIGELLASAGVAPSDFQLEVSESVALDERNGSPLEALQRIHDLGVRLAVDNFGTANSSLAALKRLPVHVVNIDRSFVAGAATSADDQCILRALLGLADAFGIDAVAEGIETPEQLGWLAEAGCTQGTGYLLSPPLDAASATQLIAAGTPAPARFRAGLPLASGD